MESILAEFGGGPSLGVDSIILRLLGAVAFSGLIGFEREAKNRPAGLRTHMLVGLAAASYCMIMLELLAQSEGKSADLAMDPLRLLEAVTSGVAFLAAGMIVFARGKVHGLTTGASLWLAAALGLGAGFGFWVLSAASAILALIIIRVIKVAELAAKAQKDDDVYH
jgi:putative Mg2+ transporter-C (MgtC) family protein